MMDFQDKEQSAPRSHSCHDDDRKKYKVLCHRKIILLYSYGRTLNVIIPVHIENMVGISDSVQIKHTCTTEQIFLKNSQRSGHSYVENFSKGGGQLTLELFTVILCGPISLIS